MRTCELRLAVLRYPFGHGVASPFESLYKCHDAYHLIGVATSGEEVLTDFIVVLSNDG